MDAHIDEDERGELMEWYWQGNS